MKSYTKAFIPYGGYYSTPFSRWQGSMQYDNAVEALAVLIVRWMEWLQGLTLEERAEEHARICSKADCDGFY